jgi:hypothetical protein
LEAGQLNGLVAITPGTEVFTVGATFADAEGGLDAVQAAALTTAVPEPSSWGHDDPGLLRSLLDESKARCWRMQVSRSMRSGFDFSRRPASNRHAGQVALRMLSSPVARVVEQGSRRLPVQWLMQQELVDRHHR